MAIKKNSGIKKLKKSEKEDILKGAKKWFRDTIGSNHINNTVKLVDPKELNINPFLTPYLANFLTGSTDAESIAKALIYPRILGYSITTSFGQNMQTFTTLALGAYGSATTGIDIEFTDKFDEKKNIAN